MFGNLRKILPKVPTGQARAAREKLSFSIRKRVISPSETVSTKAKAVSTVTQQIFKATRCRSLSIMLVLLPALPSCSAPFEPFFC
jgi:hypothetical protein